MKKQYAVIYHLIKDAIGGTLDQGELNEFMSKIGKHDNKDIQMAAHHLMHFMADEDIRNKDPKYDRYMKNKLENYSQYFERM